MYRRTGLPYIWATWLAPLLVGDHSCEWRTWVRARYGDIPKREDPDFDSAEWKRRHTALLNETRDEYRTLAKDVIVEREWRIEGTSAIVAGKIDLVVLEPNLIIDCKTGRPKDSDASQVRIYLLAKQMGALKGLSGGDFKGVLRYPNDVEKDVPRVDDDFKASFVALVKRIAGDRELRRAPSLSECRFCDIGNCPERIEQVESVATNQF